MSVIIPAHNAGTTLDAQVMAIRPQLGPDDEIVIVDNRSTDDTAARARRWASHDRRVVALSAPARPGAAHARNVGARRAKGVVLLFCDADDVVGDGWLDGMRRGLARHDLVAGALEVERLSDPVAVAIKGRPDHGLPRFLDTIPFAHGCNLGVQSDLWRRLGGMDEAPDVIPGEDIEFAIRAFADGASAGFAPSAVVHYRYRSGGVPLFKQAVSYNRVLPLLVRRMEDLGAGAGPHAIDPKKWLWLVARLPWLARSSKRSWWLYQAGVRLGLVQGSLKHRRVVL